MPGKAMPKRLHNLFCLLVACAAFGMVGVGAALGDATTVLSASKSSSAATKPTTEPAVGDDAFPGDGTTAANPAGAAESPELLLYKDIPVVVAAGMREQTEQQAAASVSIVNATDIQLFNYRSLADVLHGQRSFYLDTDGLNWFAGVRGFQRPGEWNSRILVLNDGTPTNELIYGQSHLDQDFVLPMEAVKQVEIIRGPGSALYGSGAVFGVLNVVTKTGADDNGIEGKVEGGSESTGHVNVLFGKQFDNGIDVIGDFTGFTSQGNDDLIYDGVTGIGYDNGHIRDANYEGVYSGFLKIRKGDVTISIDTAARKKDDAAATGLSSWYNPGDMYERRTNASIQLNHTFDDGGNLQAQFYFGHYHYEQSWPYDLTEATVPYTYFSSGDDDWIGEQIHYGRQVTKQLHLLVGVDAVQSLDTDQHDENSLTGPILNIPASYNSVGGFAEGEYHPFDWLSITAGCRLDQVQRIGLSVSPRFAAIITPTKEDAIKLMYGRAFRDPNLYELLYTSPPPDGLIGNPALKPEIVDTYELAWERQFGHGWQTSLNGYLWEMQDSMEDYVYPNGSLQTRNSGTLWANGVEGEVDYRWKNGSSWRTYASYTRAEENGNGLTHSPDWIVGSSVAMQLFNNCFVSVEPQFVGPMKSDLGLSTQPTFITNLVFTYRNFYHGWSFQAGAYNLFADKARLPRDGAYDQSQPTLDYPSTLFMVSLTKKF
jgi:outer membrane receptor for ferrienterochelin and colicins